MLWCQWLTGRVTWDLLTEPLTSPSTLSLSQRLLTSPCLLGMVLSPYVHNWTLGCQHGVWDAVHYLNLPLTFGGSSAISCLASAASLPSTKTLTPSQRQDTIEFFSSTLLLSAKSKSLSSLIPTRAHFPPQVLGWKSKMKWKTYCAAFIFKGGVKLWKAWLIFQYCL